MVKYRTDRGSKESGIALVTTMIITMVVLMLITGVTHLLIRGFGANVLNRQFTTAYDAANGGAEYGAAIINSQIDSGDIDNLIGNTTTETDVANLIQNCTATTETFDFQTADGLYNINIEMSCLGVQGIPGQGDALAFPPPPGSPGGGAGTHYVFYSINVAATETNTGVMAKTESVYRGIM